MRNWFYITKIELLGENRLDRDVCLGGKALQAEVYPVGFVLLHGLKEMTYVKKGMELPRVTTIIDKRGKINIFSNLYQIYFIFDFLGW